MTVKHQRYAVMTSTICDGWTNTWLVDDEPMTFPTYEAAKAELDEFLAEIAEDIASGVREADEGYDESDFMIVEVYS